MTAKKITRSSGNVFADIGLANPDEHALKSELVRRISGALKAQSLNQTAAAKKLGISQPDVSKMLAGQFQAFSVERLMRFLVALGHDVKIVIEPVRSAKSHHAQIVVAAE
jgi:predicted XRE-type DNA-binding protein